MASKRWLKFCGIRILNSGALQFVLTILPYLCPYWTIVNISGELQGIGQVENNSQRLDFFGYIL